MIPAEYLLGLLGPQSEQETAYREALRRHLRVTDDLAALHEGAAHAAKGLVAFVKARGLLADTSLFDTVVVLPTLTNVFVNTSNQGTDWLVVSHGFLDLMMFHHRMSAVFCMCEDLATKAHIEVAGSRGIRAGLHMAHLDLIGRWLVRPFQLDDLPASRASPAHMNEELNVLLQGLVFLLLHERGHIALRHRAEDPPSGLTQFNLVTHEELDSAKVNELEADAWALRALSWPRDRLLWQVTAVVRMFLLIGLGQAAAGRFPSTHPYVSNRLSHLVSVLRGVGIEVDTLRSGSGEFLAREYDSWKARRKAELPTTEVVGALALLSVEAAKHWHARGGDEVLLG